MKQKHRRALRGGSGNPAKLAIVDRLRELGHRHRLYQVFCDFVEISAIALANRCDLIRAPAREARYMETIRRYSREELQTFCEALALLQMAYEVDGSTGLAYQFDDVLGETFMALEFGNDYAGQFFTPIDICRFMAQLTFDESGVRDAIERSGYVSVGEPACGAAAMIIAAAERLASMGIEYQKHMVVIAVDISETAVHMAFLQCAFLGIPAVIVHGNSLTLQEHSAWLTPMYVNNGHATRDIRAQRQHYLTEELRVAAHARATSPPNEASEAGQGTAERTVGSATTPIAVRPAELMDEVADDLAAELPDELPGGLPSSPATLAAVPHPLQSSAHPDDDSSDDSSNNTSGAGPAEPGYDAPRRVA